MDNAHKTRVILEADDKTKKGIDSSVSNLNRLGGVAKSLSGTLLGLTGVVGVGAFTGLVLGVAKTADEMLKAAQAAGTTTERLSELEYAGELAGVSAESIEKALSRAAKSAEDFRNKSKIAIDAFAKIGLDPTQFKDSADLFEAIIGKLSKMEDGTRKTAIAQELLGKSGKDLIPLINGGADGLARAAAEARELGIVIETETAKQAEILNDNLLRLQKSAKGLQLELGAPMIGSLADFTNAMLDAKRAGDGFFATLNLLFTKDDELDGVIDDTKDRLESLTKTRDALSKPTLANKLNDVIFGDVRDLNFQIEVANKELDTLFEKRRLIVERLDLGVKPSDVAGAEPVNPNDIKSTGKSPNESARDQAALLTQINSLLSQGVSLEDAKTIAQMHQKGVSDEIIVQLLNQQNINKQLVADEKQAEKERLDAIKLREEWLKNSAKQRLDINTMLWGLEQEAAKAQEEVNRSLDDELDALKFEYSIRGLTTEEQTKQVALRAAALDFEKAMFELNQAGVYLTEEETEALKAKYDEIARIKGELTQTDDTARDFGLTFNSALEDAVVNGKELSDVMKSLEQDILRILTRKAVTEPLTKGIDGILDGIDFGGIFSDFFNANGNAFNSKGIVPFAKGGIVNQATPFTFANGGKFGVMGEAGPEAILPLSRGPNGKLGVQSMGDGGGNTSLTVNIIGAPSQPEVRQRDDGNGNMSMDIIFDAVDAHLIKDFRSEGNVAQTLQGQYGLNRNAGAR